MLFSHDTERALSCIVDLVNSAPSGEAGELMPDVPALTAFVATHAVTDVRELGPDDVAGMHALRSSVTEVFDAPDDAAAAAAVNALVSRAAVSPRLTAHDGYDWHVHYAPQGVSLPEHLTIDCGMALAHVVAAGERERLRRCEAPDCDQVLVDLSRNRSRRYCDARTCGNRLHVAAYRERRRAAGV